jgi:predicted lipoprotein with Yx(FWY)xxD motif
VIARAAGSADDSAVEIHSLERGADGMVTMRFSIVNDPRADAAELGGYDFVDPSQEVRDFGSVGGVHLLDARSMTKLEVARDGDGRCLCSRRIGGIGPGQRLYAWAKFADVSPEVAAVSVVVPKFQPAEEVPVTAAATPSTTVAGAREGTSLTVQELARGADGSLTLRVEIANQSERELGGYDFTDPDHEVADFSTLGGVLLLDARSMTIYEVDRDADGRCICATDLRVPSGRTARAWAKFTGLPADLGAVTVLVPQFDAVEEVAVQAPAG